MTSLHPTATDPSLPGPPADRAGSSPPAGDPPVAAVPPAPSGRSGAAPVPAASSASAPICSIVTVAESGAAATGVTGAPVRQGGACRHDSVPQPRTREDAEAYVLPTADPASSTGVPTGDPTAERLRAAFADRLRAARAEGRSVTDLAAACRRSAEEVRTLLGEPAEDDPSGEGDPSGGVGPEAVRLRQPSAPPEGDRPSPTPRSAREEVRSYGSRRPSPSRRLRRMHPQTDRTGQEAAARETAATDPVGAE
ncbi:hypothetical protein J0670_36930, partial [Streptomyces sp. FH025]